MNSTGYDLDGISRLTVKTLLTTKYTNNTKKNNREVFMLGAEDWHDSRLFNLNKKKGGG